MEITTGTYSMAAAQGASNTAQGTTGIQGPDGAAGAQGPSSSSQGATGTQGSTGGTGSQGPSSASQGASGTQGSTGATGSQGPSSSIQGASGVQGDTGATGGQGASNSTQGPSSSTQGPTAAQGAKGAAGAKGAQGTQGPSNSTQGATAASQGTTGAQGGVGAQGGKGAQGTQGPTSDIRLKKNLRPYAEGVQTVLSISPISFEWNGLGGQLADGRENVSVIANHLQQVIPEAVFPVKGKLHPEDQEETDILNFDVVPVVMADVNAIKQQAKTLESLMERIARLENAPI